MLFNSIDFLIFFPFVCVVYFALPKLLWRNVFLLGACYWFYASWQPVYLLLLMSATIVTYLSALLAERYSNKRIFILSGGVLIDLGMLFFFKYFNFAADLLSAAMDRSGLRLDIPRLEVLLPVGISFYIFQGIGYLVDVGRGLKEGKNHPGAERNLLRFSLFMSFFPQLVAGPIERSRDLLPQFGDFHRFSHKAFMSGLKMMVAGYFLKLVIADRCSLYVDKIWDNLQDHNGMSCLLAAFLFSLQIYGDFAGYSLVAIGSARIMGFRLSENFSRPYHSRSVTEFWQRWHISLSRWMRDYVYIPLGGSRKGKLRTHLNLMLTMLVSGLWHGADLSFVAWGGMHGGAMVLERGLMKKDRGEKRRRILSGILRMAFTFLFITFAWIFFRAPDIGGAVTFMDKIFRQPGVPYIAAADFIAIGAGLLLWELMRVGRIRLLADQKWIEPVFISFALAWIILFGVLDGSQFIYFDF